MFLAWREIKREKLRYGLVIAMIVLISYLLFMLVGLMDGLKNENTAAIESWRTETIWLNRDSNDRLAESVLTRQQVTSLPQNSHFARIGDQPAKITVDRQHHRHPQTVQLIGLAPTEFIARNKVKLSSGHRIRNNHQLVLDESLKQKGYRLGERVVLSGSKEKFRVVGFARNAKINISPVAYGTLTTWQQLRGGNFAASAVITDQKSQESGSGMKRYPVKQFINKLPGYTAQNATLQLMIGFLLVISLVVIAVFLYILTMQKKHQYALLRAQGIPAKTLVMATISQSLVLMIVGLIFATGLTLLTVQLIPSGVPVMLKASNMFFMGIGLIAIGVAGALLPALMIIRIDPLDALK
ncbi:ABC transporter permease [uncultured Limosilactobacillus sp.]|uniref:ABC transporter permease n=1 Tax=uncultured Limosilactobacillus sp. TaxID=2837629 RepID=UPI0025CC9FFF|nr:ABC transporter permease [uncultured Limosilactobacillus sp.]